MVNESIRSERQEYAESAACCALPAEMMRIGLCVPGLGTSAAENGPGSECENGGDEQATGGVFRSGGVGRYASRGTRGAA